MQPNWWDRKKLEWLYKQEIRRKERLARKYAKLQAKEADKARREMSSGPSLGDRYQEWSRKRRLAKEQRAEELALLENDKSLFGFLKRNETKFFWAFALVAIIGLGAFITTEVKKSEQAAAKKADEKRTLARVNGEPIYVETVLERLFFAHGASMLQELSEQEVIRQEAEKLGIELSPDDKADIEKQLEALGSQKRVLKHRLEAQLLLKKLVLKSVSQERRQRVYDDFKDSLITYVFSANSFETLEKANAYVAALKNGTEVKVASTEYAIEALPPQKIGAFTETDLVSKLGQMTAVAIIEKGQRSYFGPIRMDGKILVLKLEEVLTEFDDVQDAIDDMVYRADASQFMFSLIASSKIESPFIDPELSDFKDDTPGPFDKERKSPTPVASATP